MSEINKMLQISGEAGVNIAGDNNNVFYYQQPIKYELLSKLCKDIINSDLCGNQEMNIKELPIELLEKIEYNKLEYHRALFEELGVYLSDIQNIVESSLGEQSLKLIRIIKYMYYEISASNTEYTNDQILFKMEEELIRATDLFENEDYLNEDLNYCISQILLYVFAKCQILKKPAI